MVFIILQPPSMFARFRCWLKLHVGTSPSSCNKHSSFYFLDQYLLEQVGQKLLSNFFIFKIVSFSLPFLPNCLYFSRKICSLTSSIELHFFFPHNKHRYFSTLSRMLLFNEISVPISVNTSLALVLFSNSLKGVKFPFLLKDTL